MVKSTYIDFFYLNKRKKRVTLTIIALLAMVSIVLAQSDCKRDVEAKKFSGTWKWEKGKDSFELVLKFGKINLSFPDMEPLIIESIWGYHKFIKGGNTIEDSTPFKNVKFDTSKEPKHTLFGNTNAFNVNILEGAMTHSSKNNKMVEYKIKYIDSNHIKLVEVYNTEGMKLSTDEHPYDSSISLPQNIVLKRVK